jgi:hypothetical protein
MLGRKRLFAGTVSLAQGLRLLAIPVAGLFIAVAIYMWSQQVKVEAALRYSCALPAFEEVSAECVEEVYVPVNRKFDVVSDPAQVVGMWTVHPVGAGEMAHPSQLTADEPDRFRFTASGESLPEGLYGYHFSVPEPVLGAVSPGRQLTLSLADSMGRQLIVVLDKVIILDEGDGGVFLGLTMDQVAAVESLIEQSQAEVPEGESPPRLVWMITQGVNPDQPPLAVYQMTLTAGALGGEP